MKVSKHKAHRCCERELSCSRFNGRHHNRMADRYSFLIRLTVYMSAFIQFCRMPFTKPLHRAEVPRADEMKMEKIKRDEDVNEEGKLHLKRFTRAKNARTGKTKELTTNGKRRIDDAGPDPERNAADRACSSRFTPSPTKRQRAIEAQSALLCFSL